MIMAYLNLSLIDEVAMIKWVTWENYISQTSVVTYVFYSTFQGTISWRTIEESLKKILQQLLLLRNHLKSSLLKAVAPLRSTVSSSIVRLMCLVIKMALVPVYFAKSFSDPNIWGLLERCFSAIESTPSLSAVSFPNVGASYQEREENQRE